MSIKFGAMFVVAFLSLFFPIPVYPLIFLAFSFFMFIKTRPHLNLSDNRDRASLSVVAFVLIGVAVSWINDKPVWCDPGIKLVLNMMFLCTRCAGWLGNGLQRKALRDISNYGHAWATR